MLDVRTYKLGGNLPNMYKEQMYKELYKIYPDVKNMEDKYILRIHSDFFMPYFTENIDCELSLHMDFEDDDIGICPKCAMQTIPVKLFHPHPNKQYHGITITCETDKRKKSKDGVYLLFDSFEDLRNFVTSIHIRWTVDYDSNYKEIICNSFYTDFEKGDAKIYELRDRNQSIVDFVAKGEHDPLDKTNLENRIDRFTYYLFENGTVNLPENADFDSHIQQILQELSKLYKDDISKTCRFILFEKSLELYPVECPNLI